METACWSKRTGFVFENLLYILWAAETAAGDTVYVTYTSEKEAKSRLLIEFLQENHFVGSKQAGRPQHWINWLSL